MCGCVHFLTFLPFRDQYTGSLQNLPKLACISIGIIGDNQALFWAQLNKECLSRCTVNAKGLKKHGNILLNLKTDRFQ